MKSHLVLIAVWLSDDLGMLNSFFSNNWSSIVQNQVLTEARSIPEMRIV